MRNSPVGSRIRALTVALALATLCALALAPTPARAPLVGGSNAGVPEVATLPLGSQTPPRAADDRSAPNIGAAAAAPPVEAAPARQVAAAQDEQAHLRYGSPLTVEHPDVLPVREVQRRHTADLLRDARVVGTAIGQDERGNIALLVLLKVPADDLPRTLDGVPVVPHVTGEIFSTKGPPADKGGGKGGGEPAPDPTSRFARPVPIGVSTGHPFITAGTIGCRVISANNGGDLFALSNNHVYANENSAILGDAALQPGPFDGGTSPDDAIGELHDFEPLDFSSISEGGANTMDAAIVLSDALTLGNATPSNGYGTPRTSTLGAAINLRVRKYGRTTGLTSGKIFAINATLNIGYDSGTAGFVGQFLVSGGAFSSPGDSGSLIVGQQGADARKPVGLLFAGSGSTTVASPIGPILTRFGVTIDGD